MSGVAHATLCCMLSRILQNVSAGMADFTRRLKHVHMISLSEDFTLCTHELVEAACYANGKTADGPCTVGVIACCTNEVYMITLCGIVDNTAFGDDLRWQLARN